MAKNDGSMKIAPDGKLNARIVPKQMQMPCLEALKAETRSFWASTITLKDAFGLEKLAKNTARPCVIAILDGKATGHYRFKRGFYGVPDMPGPYFHQRCWTETGATKCKCCKMI